MAGIVSACLVRGAEQALERALAKQIRIAVLKEGSRIVRDGFHLRWQLQ
jgi:hypothetical protein